jgi:hypothetical protein
MSTEQDARTGSEDSAEEIARKKEEERDKAAEEMRQLEEADELPASLEEWPGGAAKYETFGADDDAYGEGATEKLGPPNLTRHPDGSVEIDGEKVDNPDDYKGEPIAGGLPGDED